MYKNSNHKLIYMHFKVHVQHAFVMKNFLKLSFNDGIIDDFQQ